MKDREYSRGYPKPRRSARYRVLHNIEVVDLGYISPCWRWLGEVDRNGYGRVKDKGTRIPAHWAIKGKPPEGLEYDHLCEQRACVRPDHGEYVTHAENLRRKGTR